MQAFRQLIVTSATVDLERSIKAGQEFPRVVDTPIRGVEKDDLGSDPALVPWFRP